MTGTLLALVALCGERPSLGDRLRHVWKRPLCWLRGHPSLTCESTTPDVLFVACTRCLKTGGTPA